MISLVAWAELATPNVRHLPMLGFLRQPKLRRLAKPNIRRQSWASFGRPSDDDSSTESRP